MDSRSPKQEVPIGLIPPALLGRTYDDHARDGLLACRCRCARARPYLTASVMIILDYLVAGLVGARHNR